jgi:hypothetical protein
VGECVRVGAYHHEQTAVVVDGKALDPFRAKAGLARQRHQT